LYVFGSFMMGAISRQSAEILGNVGSFELTEKNIYMLVLRLFFLIVLVLAPLVITIVVTSITSHVVQDGGRFEFRWERLSLDINKLNPLNGFGRLFNKTALVFRWERLSLDINKLNPLNGFGRLFNKTALVEIIKSFLKLLVIGWIAYRVLADEVQNITLLAEADMVTIVSYMGHVAFKIVVHACGIMLIISILDLMYVKWQYTDNLKMTKQEVKDENKEQENPEIKGQIKKMQFQTARRRMTKIIPTADVVITNPTHFAVALKYDRQRMIAPVVLAKGADIMAQAIKKIARENKVVLVENRFLARELYEQVDENEAIPESLYAAVAEVLAYVYRLKGSV